MTTKLQEIINYKKEEFIFEKNKTNEFEINSNIDMQEKPKNFIKSLEQTKTKFALIAVIKKA
jgi:indole-3-glycerol phosphate synthase